MLLSNGFSPEAAEYLAAIESFDLEIAVQSIAELHQTPAWQGRRATIGPDKTQLIFSDGRWKLEGI